MEFLFPARTFAGRKKRHLASLLNKHQNVKVSDTTEDEQNCKSW